jgi:6,7-dimethyl-8-ribityllumazine synthase
MSIRGLNLSDTLDASRFRIAIIKTRWNTTVVNALVEACYDTLNDCNAMEVTVEEVGGAFELPLVSQTLAKTGKYDAIIAIGCLIKGETMHFEYISGAAVEGLMRVGLETGIPVINGILNVLSEDQALARAGLKGTHGNEGIGWAKTAIQQAHIIKKYSFE